MNFSRFNLLVIPSFTLLWSEMTQHTILICWFTCSVVHHLKYAGEQTMCTGDKCIFCSWLDGNFCRFLLGPNQISIQGQYFFISFLSGWTIHCWKKDSEVSYCYYVAISLFIPINICFIFLGVPMKGTHIFKVVLLMNWPLYH